MASDLRGYEMPHPFFCKAAPQGVIGELLRGYVADDEIMGIVGDDEEPGGGGWRIKGSVFGVCYAHGVVVQYLVGLENQRLVRH